MMAENIMKVASTSSVAKPVHIQRLERSLDMDPFLNYISQNLNTPINDDNSTSSDESDNFSNLGDDLSLTNIDVDKSKHFNFSNISSDRKWLQEILIEPSDECSSEDEITEEDLKLMLKHHMLVKKYKKKYYDDKDNFQYQYYSAGLLSNYDKYPEHRKSIVSVKKGKREKETKIEKKPMKTVMNKPKLIPDIQDDSYFNNYTLSWENELSGIKEDSNEDFDLKNQRVQFLSNNKKKHLKKNPEIMTARRKKVWILMCKKEVGKVQRAKTNNHKEVLASCKKAAQLCMRYCRQKAMQSQKNMKETLWRAKRLTREMQSYWKRYDRVERETKRRMEKEAEEQRKMDVEIIEAKRQQRKLNFLITQTELYAHFMSRKLKKGSPDEQLLILSQLDEEKNPRLASIDDYDSEVMKAKAKKNAKEAFNNERARTRQFDLQANSACVGDIEDDYTLSNTNGVNEEHPQPTLFKGILKGYQLRGMNWLANLYDQGISGILADEMGLGKTVQSIAFLCHIAERYSVWGPFLIISPASTLHNWQQEMERFVPSFKVVPYWGNPNERKILRQFWDQKDMHTKDASFHVVITSYQIVITDFKYFNRIKWQYMILDEAQAIKSTNSVRWKMLLGFSCRNRLLLSGTPIQNSMAELWALLHFIMPTLFDSHDEFNEWFSKDIENHAENKTGIDEKHLSRLHMILKPFMLRRIKKDVENELSDKIEIMVYCPLTTRQKLLYMALKKKIRIEDLLHYTISGGSESHSVDKNFTSNLMNLVMQFRKVCNHPELFERRDAKSPFYCQVPAYEIPKLFYDNDMTRCNLGSKYYILYNLLLIFDKQYIRSSLNNGDSTFSFMKFINLSINDLYNIFINSLVYRWNHHFQTEKLTNKLHIQKFWNNFDDFKYLFLLTHFISVSLPRISNSQILQDLIFTSALDRESRVYQHNDHSYYVISDSVESKQANGKAQHMGSSCISYSVPLSNDNETNIDEEVPFKVLKCQRTSMPTFLMKVLPKVQCKIKSMYCDSRSAQWDLLKYYQIHSWQGLQSIWSNSLGEEDLNKSRFYVNCIEKKPYVNASPLNPWSNIVVPDKETLVTDAGKLSVLDNLLKRLKKEGHRVLIYSQMTKMIDLLEEYMWHRKHKYMRLDGSSKISERRDMVADFQARADIFVFLLSTRAGGLGINLTAADTVIFYDSDWNPTVDQQAMDRAHRLGQTKQVTVYRLICKGSIEERILQRAREKSEIQRMVISGGNFKPDTLKPKEVVSLLLDDEEIEMKYRQRTEEKKHTEELREKEKEKERERKRKQNITPKVIDAKRAKVMDSESGVEDVWLNVDSNPQSPSNSDSDGSGIVSNQEDTSCDAAMIDLEYPMSSGGSSTFTPPYGSGTKPRMGVRGYSKRGRPRGSRSRSLGSYPRPVSGQFNNSQSTDSAVDTNSSPSLFDSSQGSSQGSSQSPRGGSPVPVRRGPGRPRLKPGGPCNQGARGVSRPRKPARPLPVPLRSGTASTNSASCSNTSMMDNMNFCFYESNPDAE